MKENVMFWLSKTLAEFIVFGIFIGAIIAIAVIATAYDLLKKKMCKHTNYYTNGATLHVFCRKCGKDLGFTGTFHEEKRKVKNDGE